MKKADKARYQKLAEIGCIICREFEGTFSPCEIHHTAGRTKDGNQKTIGLCYFHHRQGGNNHDFVSRHPWLTEFEERYKPESELLEITNKLIE